MCYICCDAEFGWCNFGWKWSDWNMQIYMIENYAKRLKCPASPFSPAILLLVLPFNASLWLK